MTLRSSHNVPVFLLISSLFALAFAYVSQYGFGLKPCVLCLYQRVPYMMIAVLSLFALAIRQEKYRNIIYGIIVAVLLTGVAIAFYHVGVEYTWFAGPDTCSGGGAAPKTLEEMRASLLGTKAVRCDQPQFVFLGLSMAGWNIVWSLFMAAGTLLLWWRKKRDG